jgi:tetratricopeptide (TPR) repeat protein
LEVLPHVDTLPPALRGAVLWGASNFAYGLDEGAGLLNGSIAAFGEAGMPTVGPRLGLGMVFLRHGLLDEAVETLERALIEFHADPSPPGRVTEWDIRRYLATAHIHCNRLDEARYHLERCAAADQDEWTYHGEADLGLAELMRLEDDLTGARDLLLQRIDAVDQLPHHDPLFDCYLYSDLARIELALGHADDARAHITRSLEMLEPRTDYCIDNEDCGVLAVAAAVAEHDNRWLTAAFIVGGIEARVSRWGLLVWPETMQVIDPASAEHRSDLDAAHFATECTAGAKASFVELIERFFLATEDRH